MFHSLPAAVIAGLLAFLICQCNDLAMRYYKAGAVVLGYVSHLLLDEMYSIDVMRLRIKKSFGTAMKLYSRHFWADASTYIKLVALTYLAFQDPVWMERFQQQIESHSHQVPQAPMIAESLLDRLRR